MLHQLMTLSAGGYPFWLWAPVVAIVVVLAAIVSLIFAFMRAATDVIIRQLAGATISRLAGGKKSGNHH